MSSLVTVDEYLALVDGDVKTMVDVLSNFVVKDNGVYLDKEEGRKLIGTLTIDELQEAIGEFTGKAEDAAVPP